MLRWFLLSGLALVLAASSALVQNFAPPEPVKPSADQLETIREDLDKLKTKLFNLKKFGIQDPFLADAEIYAKAAEWITRPVRGRHRHDTEPRAFEQRAPSG